MEELKNNGDDALRHMSDKPQATEWLPFNLFKLIICIKEHDYVRFASEHERLYAAAKASGDYAAVTDHYYSVMAEIVERAFGGSFHFAPPAHAGQSKKQAELHLHHSIARVLGHRAGRRCLDIGCGIGSTMVDVAKYAGGTVIGITVSREEVGRGERRLAELGARDVCRIELADCSRRLPFADASFDSAYALYSLKYVDDVGSALAETARVLRPGGLLLVYDLLLTSDGQQHRHLVQAIEYACGMPSLHSAEQICQAADAQGLRRLCRFDLAGDMPWYHCFVSSTTLMWLLDSSLLRGLLALLEAVGFLPRGFLHFYKVHLAGLVLNLVKAGQLGIISGSDVILFQKETPQETESEQ